MFLYEVPGNCFTGISPPLFNHNWKIRCLPRSSVTYDRFQEVFEKMLKECRVFGLKRERGEQAEKTPSRMKISLETLEINHSLCPQKTGQKKNQVHFLERSSRIHIRKNFIIVQRDESWNDTGRFGLSFSKVPKKSLGNPWAGKVKSDILCGYS